MTSATINTGVVPRGRICDRVGGLAPPPVLA